ncbi:hypothetical protein EfmAA242_32930 (plasmid) [Enterococcus faecium]|nr:hypothetical protein EfmAA242_32930 [Enterococcus faecium]
MEGVLKKSEPLVLKGIVQPKNTSYLNLDQTLGKISAISVKNGQEINENDVIATYQNTTIEDQAEEQTQSLEKLNLAVTNAQINLENATQKQQELETRLTAAKNEHAAITNKKIDEEMKKAEKAEAENKIEAAQQALDAQKDAVSGVFPGEEQDNLFSLSNINIEIPKATYHYYFKSEKDTSSLTLTLEEGVEPDKVTSKVINQLKEKGSLKHLGEYEVLDTAMLTKGIGQILSTITYFITAVAGLKFRSDARQNQCYFR